jgi:hypothetical protein
MANSDPDLERVQQSSERSIVESKHNLDNAIRKYTAARQVYPEGSGQLESLRSQLHTAVLELHWKMRAVTEAGRHWQDMSDDPNWDSDYIWTGNHPQTQDSVIIAGLSDLDDWLDNTYEKTSEYSGPKHSGKPPKATEESLRLPADAALEAAKVLVREFNDAGWDAATKTPVEETGPI